MRQATVGTQSWVLQHAAQRLQGSYDDRAESSILKASAYTTDMDA